MLVFLRFDLEHFGLERSGRSVGFISTYSRTYKSPWHRVMSKKTKIFRTIVSGQKKRELLGKNPRHSWEKSGKYQEKTRKTYKIQGKKQENI